eukprot:PhF_6_TR2886/c0_g2_i1/m.4468
MRASSSLGTSTLQSLPPVRGGAQSSLSFYDSESKRNETALSSIPLNRSKLSPSPSLLPSHVLRNTYGRHIREVVKDNAQRRTEAVTSNAATPSKGKQAAEGINECIVDIGVKEDAARRR